MATFEPPPTYADPVEVDNKLKPGQPGYSKFSPIWLKWFLDFTNFANTTINKGVTLATSIAGGSVNAIVYQSGTNTTAFLIPSTGYLVYSSGVLVWQQTGSFTTLTASLGFGCNGASAQTAYASGGSVVTTGATNVAPYGYTTAAQANAIITLLNNIRAALVANGIMS